MANIDIHFAKKDVQLHSGILFKLLHEISKIVIDLEL